jgi:hypothetical protein
MIDNGDIVVTGGSTAEAVSIYSVKNREWLRAPRMNIARAYQSSTTLSNGKVFFLHSLCYQTFTPPESGIFCSTYFEHITCWN